MESADSLLGIEEFLDSEANNECDVRIFSYFMSGFQVVAKWLLTAYQEPWIPIAFTEPKGSSPLTALKIEYCDDLPEYPTSDVNGYAYIVATKGQSPDEMRHIVDGVSGYPLLYQWLLTGYRFNMPNVNDINQSNQPTVHFLNAMLIN